MSMERGLGAGCIGIILLARLEKGLGCFLGLCQARFGEEILGAPGGWDHSRR